MDISSDLVLFLGAGASLPAPAGGPLFDAIRDACAKRAGLDPRSLHEAPGGAEADEARPALTLLEHVIPEVFLKELADAGYELHGPLTRAIRGTPGSGPNAVHRLAADLLAGGGEVWTTNWDTWIEQAWQEEGPGHKLDVAVALRDDPTTPSNRLLKLHGTADDPRSLRFATGDIMRPLPREWHDRLVGAATGRTLVIVGYAGADIDLYPALAAAIRSANATFWFEGAGEVRVDDSDLAAYEQWRFGLEDVVDPRELPNAGAHLVWCGSGSSVGSPSEGLMAVFGYQDDVSKIPTPTERFAAVDAEISQVEQATGQLGPRLRLAARVYERLGRRWRAAIRHAAVVVVGPMPYRRRSVRAIGNLVLLRAQPLRAVASKLVAHMTRSEERAEFLMAQGGGVDHDPARAARIADGSEQVSVDHALTVAGITRWAGNLTVAERIARMQFSRALAEDLSSAERDWPERASRACFEIAQTLTWQGRLYEAEEQAKSAYMRASGAKWMAWEYTFRAIARFSEGAYREAAQFFDMTLKLLQAEGFRDFTPQIWCEQAACMRAIGEVGEARRLLAIAEQIPRKGPGSLAVILAERAEIYSAARQEIEAQQAWSALTLSKLPLWSAIGHLRLAEHGYTDSHHAQKAIDLFKRIECRWGVLRGSALIGEITLQELEDHASSLGPVDIFRPRARWLL